MTTIDLSRLNFNKIGEYKQLEFYPKNHILAYGEFNERNTRGIVYTISISIMKINTTEFSACSGYICGSEECQKKYKTDKELNDDYYEDMVPEYSLVSLVYDKGCLKYKSISYVTDELQTIDDIIESKEFNDQLEYYLKELFNL